MKSYISIINHVDANLQVLFMFSYALELKFLVTKIDKSS